MIIATLFRFIKFFWQSTTFFKKESSIWKKTPPNSLLRGMCGKRFHLNIEKKRYQWEATLLYLLVKYWIVKSKLQKSEQKSPPNFQLTFYWPSNNLQMTFKLTSKDSKCTSGSTRDSRFKAWIWFFFSGSSKNRDHVTTSCDYRIMWPESCDQKFVEKVTTYPWVHTVSNS